MFLTGEACCKGGQRRKYRYHHQNQSFWIARIDRLNRSNAGIQRLYTGAEFYLNDVVALNFHHTPTFGGI